MGRFDSLTRIEEKPVRAPIQSDSTLQPTIQPESRSIEEKMAYQQDGLPAKQLNILPPTQQTIKPLKPLASKTAKQHASKQLKKFTSYLTESSLKVIKRIALDSDRKDYEVLQEAIDSFIKSQK